MKVSVNDVEIFTLSDVKKDVIKNDIRSDTFDDDMKRRLDWILNHKYKQSFKRLKAEWEPKLAALGVAQIPTDPDAFAALVFARPEYKDRLTRDQEAGL